MLFKNLYILFILFFIAGTTYSQKHDQPKKKHLKSVSQKAKKIIIKYGTASFYANRLHLKKTSSGEAYDKGILTGACNSLPLHSWVKVTNLKNNKSVILKINDRLHKKNHRLLDVSYAAAEKLAFISRGTAKVKLELLNDFKLQQDSQKN